MMTNVRPAALANKVSSGVNTSIERQNSNRQRISHCLSALRGEVSASVHQRLIIIQLVAMRHNVQHVPSLKESSDVQAMQTSNLWATASVAG